MKDILLVTGVNRAAGCVIVDHCPYLRIFCGYWTKPLSLSMGINKETGGTGHIDPSRKRGQWI